MAASDTRFIVLKFGGTSVSSRANWDIIADIAQKKLDEGLKPVIVCSALSGVSNTLEDLLTQAITGDQREVLDDIKRKHQDLCADMGLSFDDLIAGEFKELEQLALGASLIEEVSSKLHAKILSYGERMSTILGAAYLNTRENKISCAWMDARRFLIAEESARVSDDRRYLAASCPYARDPELIANFAAQNSAVILTQGFIASNRAGDTVLLGRGGSDTSAAYIAAKLKAERLEIWTDVPGVFSANPRLIPSARLIMKLDYNEAQEVTHAGAKVLHPRCIRPVRDARIPLHIRCTTHPDMMGTVITDAQEEYRMLVKAISSRTGIQLISMDNDDMWQQPGFLADAFHVFKRHGVSIDLVSTSETNVTVSLDTTDALDPRTVQRVMADLESICNVRHISGCSLVSLVGQNIRNIMNVIGPAMQIFGENKIYLVSLSASDLNFTIVVDDKQAERFVRKLHELLIQADASPKMFGPSWRALFDDVEINEVSGESAWWRARKDELIALAGAHSPRFVYDEASIQSAADRLLGMSNVSRVLYAIKANDNPEVLKTLHARGLGFECVSIGELKHLQSLFPDLDPAQVLFTPNFAPREEYEYGFEMGCNVTLDNLHPLQAWPEVFRGKDVFVRLDPGHGRGHHKHVHTAGAASKFGISIEQIDTFLELIDALDVRVVGLHAHAGSGIRTPHNWRETAAFLNEMSEYFPDLAVIDLGGGLGIPEKPGQNRLDVDAVNESLADIRAARPDLQVWLEPGRYIIAQAGVILTRVTQTKTKGDFKYIGVDVGMNTLIRPALYGAYHEIANLSRLNEPKTLVANIVGPICESGDTFGYSRRFQKSDTGDVVLIATAGAYGRTMSSHYNQRPPAEEYFLKAK